MSLSRHFARHHGLDFALPGPLALDELGMADEAHVVNLHVLDRRVAQVHVEIAHHPCDGKV